jgi:hypothetical protein
MQPKCSVELLLVFSPCPNLFYSYFVDSSGISLRTWTLQIYKL